MQLIAKLIQVLPLQSGESRNGAWKKQEIIVETEGQYPKKICVSIWGDKIPAQLRTGTNLTIDFDIESREFNGRWYTDVKAWKVAEVSGSSDSPLPSPMDSYEFLEPPVPPAPDFNDLPF